MRHALRSAFQARSFERQAGPGKFEAAYTHRKLANVGLTFCDYSVPVRIGFPELTQVRQQFCLSGAAETKSGKTTVQIDGDRSCVIPAHADSELNFGAGYRQIILHIDADALESQLAHLLGVSPGAPLQFLPSVDFHNQQADRLRRLVHFVSSEVFATAADRPDPMLVEFEQSLLRCFLFANQHNYSHLLEREPFLIAPRQGRKAEEYLEAHWREAVTAEALAGVTGVSVRSIFRYFKNAHGCTPMEFAKRIRLQRARTMLLTREHGASVTAVAFACGFQNPGHFARDYRMRFGELPSQTLKGSAR